MNRYCLERVKYSVMTKQQSSWWVLGLMLIVCLTGCASSHDTARANDRLREKVVDLEKQVKQRDGQIAHLQARVKEAETTAAGSVELRNNTPHVALITIDSLSHLRDIDGDGKADALVAYIEATDGWGRSIQLVGQLSIHAVVMPLGYDAITLGRVSLGPAEVRKAYRSSIIGTHYTVNMALLVPEGVNIDQITVNVEYVDGYSGVSFRAQQPVKYSGPFDFDGSG